MRCVEGAIETPYGFCVDKCNVVKNTIFIGARLKLLYVFSTIS
jgi:hypothetical protein